MVILGNTQDNQWVWMPLVYSLSWVFRPLSFSEIAGGGMSSGPVGCSRLQS